MQAPSAAPPWEAQMLCWLAFGEHEALKGDMKRARILILTKRKMAIPLQIYPTDSRATTFRRSSWEAQNVLLASIWRT